MRFENYILTEGRIKKISVDVLKKSIEGKFSDSFKIWNENELKYIFRGTDSTDVNFAIGNGKGKTKRKSRNTKNYSTLFFDNHPMWSKFPKRSESFVCSTNSIKAAGYGYMGSTYSVLPANGTTIGVCPQRDIFTSFKTIPRSYVGEVNSFIVSVMESMSDHGFMSDFQDDDYKRMIKTFDGIKKFFGDLDEHDREDVIEHIDTLYGDIDPFDGDILGVLEKIYDPKVNGFTLSKAGKPLPDDKEVWMSGECLFINVDYDFSREEGY